MGIPWIDKQKEIRTNIAEQVCRTLEVYDGNAEYIVTYGRAHVFIVSDKGTQIDLNINILGDYVEVQFRLVQCKDIDKIENMLNDIIETLSNNENIMCLIIHTCGSIDEAIESKARKVYEKLGLDETMEILVVKRLPFDTKQIKRD